uniref:Uncharacterized protein n=1 Tax=Hordeum vulgare subsp. vulgare TaxID=112509 RepID=A0A8I6XY27_HORVV
MYNGTRFEVMQSFKVQDGEDVSQLSWDREGKFVLATVNKDGGQAKLYIINHASRRRSSIAQIIDHPQAESSTPLVFTAKFHPVDPLFISVAGDTVWIWRKGTIQSKWQDTHVLKINAYIGRNYYMQRPLICFDGSGEMLAVCEGDDSVSVWSFVPEEMIRRPEMKLLTRCNDLERIVSLDWMKNTIVVANQISTCVYTVNKNLLINGTGNLKLKCKRSNHTHFYEQLCMKIDPRRTDYIATGGKDGYATVWKCVDKKDTVPMRRRNYLAEAAYYQTEVSPPPSDSEDQTGDDDNDVRTLIRCETSDEDETDKENVKEHKEPSKGEAVAGATQEEYASVGALPLDMLKIPIGKRMFCNKQFSMKPIAAVGFYMEHTLARYKFEQFGDLIYRNAIDKLVNKFDHPKEILQWRFDSKYMIRGLVLDKNKGNILKIDKYNSVEVAFHGLNAISKEEIANVYGNKMFIQDSFTEPDYAIVDNVFSNVEAYLFSQLVTFKDKNGEAKYEVLHRNVRHAIDMCCREGCLEQEIQKDPSRYIHMDPAIIAMLRMIRESGRRTFLLVGYFDVVITRCLKPCFFNDDQAALLAVEVESGKLINVDIEASEMRRSSQPLEQRQKVYQGGNAFHIQRLLAVESSSQIFYVSQQLYEDVLPSKKDQGWRTMLVIPELEQETEVFAESSSMREELGRLRMKRSSITNEIHHCSRSLRYQALVEKNKESEAYVHSKKMFEDKHQNLVVQLDELNLMEQVIRRNYHEKFNLHWGQIMKAGFKDSRFANQVMTIPCLYTSSITNLTHYDWEVEISPQEDDTAYELSDLDLT